MELRFACGPDLEEVTVVGANHHRLVVERGLFGRDSDRSGRIAEAAFKLRSVDDLGELVELGGAVLERGEVHCDPAAAQLDRPAIDGLQVAVLEGAGKREAQFAAGGFGRILAELVQVRAEIFGVEAAAEEGEQVLALDDDGVGLAAAGHEQKHALRGAFLDTE